MKGGIRQPSEHSVVLAGWKQEREIGKKLKETKEEANVPKEKIQKGKKEKLKKRK